MNLCLVFCILNLSNLFQLIPRSQKYLPKWIAQMFQFVRLKQYFCLFYTKAVFPFNGLLCLELNTPYSASSVHFLSWHQRNCYNNHINASEKLSVNELLSTIFLCLLHRIFFCFRSAGLSFSSVDRVSRKKTEGLPSALRRKPARRKTIPALESLFLLSAAVQIRYDNPVIVQYAPDYWSLPNTMQYFPPVYR